MLDYKKELGLVGFVAGESGRIPVEQKALDKRLLVCPPILPFALQTKLVIGPSKILSRQLSCVG